MDHKLTCRVVTDLQGFERLAPFWDRLLAASPDATPWQSFDFLSSWWRHLGGKKPLRIFVVERNCEPCLLAPMQISSDKRMPGLGVRLLEPMAMVMDVNRPRLALGALDPDAYDCLFASIWAHSIEWDALCLDEKPWDDPEVAMLRDQAIARECIFRHGFSHLVPYLDLQRSWESYLATRSQKLRKNLKAARRKLENHGPVQLREYRGAQLEAGLDVVINLHRLSWKSRKKVEHSHSDAYQRFFRAWMAKLAMQDGARVLALFSNDRPVAATIAVLHGPTYYSAQIVHDKEFAACSPGTLLEAMELESLMNAGSHVTYDMLGSFLNNKLRWTDSGVKTSHVFVLRKTLRNFLLDWYYFFVKPYLRPSVLRLLARIRRKKHQT